MMAGPGAGAERKMRAGIAWLHGSGTAPTNALLWNWYTYLVVGVLALAILVVAWRRHGRRDDSLSGRGPDDETGPVGPTARRWHTLLIASRLMPRSAGNRWLAEADSLLSEIAGAQRGAAIRSYLLSTPRLVMTMWARQVTRWARLGSRRPG